MQDRIIDFNNIIVLMNKARILDSVNLTIDAGEHTAILGPNGSGKSTLIKLMTREIYPYSMEEKTFKIFGEDTWDIHTLRGKLGIVSDSISLLANPDVTVFDVVASSFYDAMNMYNMEASDEVREKAVKSLEFMEVAHLKERLISEISSGEARRVFIARALAHNPKAILLDEPTNSLDIYAMRKFRATISRIANKGVTVIISTHTMQDIIPEIKKVVMLKGGKIYMSGKIKDVLTEKNLTGLFGTNVKLREEKGHYIIS
ncbi:MAG: ATP-binding cassette domain-containing protein [Candidatus Goldiibacteriota bacterium]|jgi:iron complex transport system ATP-binding protein